MKAKELKQKLTLDHVITLMEEMGGDPIQGRNDNEMMFRTVCHDGDSHKLYFYKSDMNFHCYTHCGSMDILQIVQNVMGIELPQAIKFICDRFGFQQEFYYGLGTQEIDNADWEIINRYKSKVKKTEQWKDFKVIDEKVFNIFHNFYHKSFLNDGISKKVMDKFEIKYDIYNDRIIIPHRHITGELIAVRCRNLEEYLVNTGRKYMPIMYDGKLLSAPTSQYFYGLYHNKDNIVKSKRVVLVESEKAVMQFETMFPGANVALALSSSNLSVFQINILKELGVEEVVVALDKEFECNGTREEALYALKIDKAIVNRLNNFNVSILWDFKGLLNNKDSPLDKGKEIYLKLYNERIHKHRWERLIDEIQIKR